MLSISMAITCYLCYDHGFISIVEVPYFRYLSENTSQGYRVILGCVHVRVQNLGFKEDLDLKKKKIIINFSLEKLKCFKMLSEVIVQINASFYNIIKLIK